MHSDNETNKSWRDNWFVSLLIEFPVIGSFIKHQNLSEAAFDAGKCVAMLTGGTTGMMVCPADKSDSIPAQAAQMMASMAIGGYVCKGLYITTCKTGTMLYQYAKTKCSSQIEDLETQRLFTTPPSSRKMTPNSTV